MLGKIIAIGSILAAVGLSFLLQATTPSGIGPLGILFVFVLMYLVALGVFTFLILGVQVIINKLFTVVAVHGRVHTPIEVTRAYYFASVLALAPVMIIGMQSVGRVGVYEFSLVVLFLIIACIYIARRTR